MKKNLKLKTLAVAVIAVAGMQSTFAEVGSIFIQANTDNSAGSEGVFITSNGVGNGGLDGSAGARFLTNGSADVYGGSLNLIGRDATNITGAGNVTIGNANNTTTIQSSTNNITSGVGGTNINDTGIGDVTIGNQQNFTFLNGVENNIGVNSFATINNMGTGTAASTNNIGNNRAETTIDAQAGNASMSLANGSASTSVTGGVSQLTARTGVANVATSSQVLLSNGGGAKVDANGKLSATGAAAAAPTVGVTLNNGYGNTNGMVITESQSVMSGGTAASSASSLSMNDSGARFSNAATGAPVTVTGVADGKNDFDAVNVRQFAGAIAAVAAQANVPALAAGQTRTVGIGLGNFMGKTGLALGMNLRGDNNATYKLSVSTGLNGGAKAVVGAGAAWGF